jgi:hypothetical protein
MTYLLELVFIGQNFSSGFMFYAATPSLFCFLYQATENSGTHGNGINVH